MTWRTLTERDCCEWKLNKLTLVIGMCGDPVRDLPCVQLASYLEGSPLMWNTLLHLHVYLNANDHDDVYNSKVQVKLVTIHYL